MLCGGVMWTWDRRVESMGVIEGVEWGNGMRRTLNGLNVDLAVNYGF